MKNIINRIVVITLSLVCILTSCNKTLDVASTRVVGEVNMWNSQADAKTAMIGIFGLGRAAFCDNDRHWLYGDLRSINGIGGDFRSNGRLDLKAIADNNLTATYDIVDQLSNWRRFYAVINAANLFIENAPNILQRDPHYLPADLQLDLANARFLRALTYFYIARIWGNVPLILTSHDGTFDNEPQAPQAKVLAFVESELQAIIPYVPMAYDTTPLYPEQSRTWYIGAWEATRKWAVYALLAHVYAWEGKYDKAAVCAKWVLDNMRLPASVDPTGRGASLFFMNVDQMRQMFRGEYGNNQNNIIFGFSHAFWISEAVNSGSLEELTLAAPYIIKKSAPDIYVPKDSVLTIFNEVNDNRFYLDPILLSPPTDRYFGAFDRVVPIFTKVFIVRDNNPPLNTLSGPGSDGSITNYGSAVVFSRPEDMELLLAEADCVTGDIANATFYLNQERTNRGLPNYSAAVNGPLIDAIFMERRRELMGEGHRWYDMIRYKKIKNNDAAFLALINNGGIYWPIAKSVLAENPLLVQNPYWKN